MSDLAVIVPTRGRPGNVRKVIAAWDFTCAWGDADMVLVVDSDDPEIQGYRDLVRAADLEELRLVEVPVWQPMVTKLNDAAQQLAGEYWALGFAGDDHLPQTIGWAKRYLTVLREMGTGMVYSDDGYQGVKLSTEWAVTSDVVRALGRMVPADVEHMYCDNSMMDLFGSAHALRWLYEVRIEHFNPYAGHKAPMDAQYQRVNHRDQYAKDRRGYERWKRAGMAADVAALRELRAGLPQFDPPRATPPTPARAAVQPRTGPGHPVRRQPHRGRTTPVQRHVQPPAEFDQVRAATPADIMITLADFAAQVSTGHEIVELGVFHGRTALQMAWGARQGHHAHVTAVDAWTLPGNTYGPPFTDDESRRMAEHWVQTLGYGDSITLINDFSVNVAARWTGQPVGLLFVDADHSKEGARRDITSWAPHLFFCARIAVDDYGHPDYPGVREAVDALVAEGFLEPVQIFHDRLAVTTLTEQTVAQLATHAATPDPGVQAITGEGVYPAPQQTDLEQQWQQDPETAATIHDPVPGPRVTVADGELPGVPAGTRIDTLPMTQLKLLAKARGIVLSTRVHKRSATVQALMEGR